MHRGRRERRRRRQLMNRGCLFSSWEVREGGRLCAWSKVYVGGTPVTGGWREGGSAFYEIVHFGGGEEKV